MEKAINRFSETVHSAIAKCLAAGYERPPNNLLRLLENYDDPINALSDIDTGNVVFEAFLDEFGFLRRLQVGNGVISAPELEDLTGLLRWLFQQLIAWNEVNDPQHQKLTACFVVAQTFWRIESVWESFPIQIANNKALLNYLTTLLSSYKANLSLGARGRAFETEILQKFVTADSTGDWPTIGDLLPRLDHLFFSNVFLTQSVCCLFQFAFGNLVTAISKVSQINVALEIARALSTVNGLKLAAASANTYVQFAVVWQISLGRIKAQPLAGSENAALENIFASVANDQQRWVLWMQCFNRYPARYPALQIALGKFLASAPEAIITTYFESISLRCGMMDNRLAVANCLKTFRVSAVQKNRESAWTCAFKLWSQWNFGISDSHDNLVRIETSELDYAIVGYCLECLSSDQRNAALEKINKALFSLDTPWHSSLANFYTETYRLLSQIQPYAHAIKLNPSDEWLWAKREYLPFDVNKNRYAAMLFNLFMPPKIEFITPEKLSAADLEACLAVLEEGKAVNIKTARTELPLAVQIAVHRDANKIVAVGAVKRSRPAYAEDKASPQKANYPFDKNIHEVGYIAVLESHRGEKLSRFILNSLLADFGPRPVFATTFNERMKIYLKEFGFERKGNQWQNAKRQWLSLWIKMPPVAAAESDRSTVKL